MLFSFHPVSLFVYAALTKGVSAPQGVHPDQLVRASYSGTVPAPLRVPYQSRDIWKDSGIVYRRLEAGLRIVFDWISEQVSLSLSNKYRLRINFRSNHGYLATLIL